MTAEVCPYCRGSLLAEEQVTECEGCGTHHHTDCFEENGGCTIFGCTKAPVDEPKMTISGPDLATAARSASGTRSFAAAAQAAVAPPPPPGVDPPPAVEASQQSLENLRRAYSNVVPSMFGIYGPESDGAYVEPAPEIPSEPKSRTTFILLGALLGALGAHNFYAGYTKKAVWQLAITVVTFGFGSPMSWIWAIIDICTVNEDNRGVQFES
ncbi:MAG TPA: NINE protein [Terriglobales bacterium]|nr:NINE protein [Terriglobales bacterium]